MRGINRQVAQPYIQGLTANNMGYIVLERQQPRRALVAFKAARAIRQDLGSKAYEMMDVSGMARDYLGLNRIEDARRWSRLALDGLRAVDAVEDMEHSFCCKNGRLRAGRRVGAR